MEKPPKLNSYDEKEDPDEHVQYFDDHIYYYHIQDATK